MDSTPLQDGAAGVHELFKTLVESGFTEMQALYMIGVMLAAGAQNS